jgi:hypothetical protein
MIHKTSLRKSKKRSFSLKTKNKSQPAIKTKIFFSQQKTFSKSLNGATLFKKMQFQWNHKSMKSNLPKRSL